MTSSGWHELAATVASCTACPELAATRTRTVPGQPPPGLGGVVLVGEAPGAQEDTEGRPFVGRAGRLLDDLLGLAGMDRAQLGVLNVLKCRPPGNRAPRPAEVLRCRGYLERQLALAAPAVVVALGGTATRWFLGRDARLTQLRGRVHDAGWPVLPTYHPSAALRFGPRGAPRAALLADLTLAAEVARG